MTLNANQILSRWIEDGTTTPEVAVADGGNAAMGTTTDAAASSTVAEDTAARTGIGLWKGIKNILILLNAKFVSGTDIGDVTVNNAADAGVYTRPGTAATFPVSVASGQIASGGVASGAVVAGAMVAGSQVDGHSSTLGLTTDAAASSTVAEDTTARTGIGLWKGIKNILILMNAKFAALGQAAMAASMPVVIANNQSDVPVTLDGEAITSAGTTISQTPAITAGAYSAGDAVGGLLTFAAAARVSAGGGVIKGVLIVDDAGQDAELELWLFNQTFTAMTDNNAWAPSEADLENLIGVISTETSDQGWMAAGTPSVVDIEVARRYDLTGTSLFGQLVSPTDTPTYAATDDLTVKVLLLQD